MANDTLTHDGFQVEEYDGSELPRFATVWVQVPGLEGVGDWAVIDEDGDAEDPMVSARFWGQQYPSPMNRANFKYVMLHSCECGNTGGTEWRICHPEA
jgi:hypothetical protein